MNEEDVVPLRTLALVLVSLLVLLAATAIASRAELQPHVATAVAFGIAAVKALLVLYFFMELKLTPKLVWIFAGAGFFWLAILATSVWTDVITRVPVVFGR